MARAAHSTAADRHAVEPHGSVALSAHTGWLAFVLHAGPVASTGDIPAGVRSRTAFQTNSHVSMVADAVGLTVHHHAAALAGAVHDQTVSHAGVAYGAVAGVTLADGLTVDSLYAGTMA
jgi:hypothetical protein